MTLKNLTFRRPLYDDRSFPFFAFLRFCHPLHPKFRQNLSCGSDVLYSLNCFSDLKYPLLHHFSPIQHSLDNDGRGNLRLRASIK